MLRDSPLAGLSMLSMPDHLIVTLFADDTTVFLSTSDDYHTLLHILHQSCRVSSAKFNTQKTVLLPIGATPHHLSMIQTCRLHKSHLPIPTPVCIAQDGKPICALGAYIGNDIGQPGLWSPILDKVDSSLKQWSKSRPTYDSKHLIISMVIGGFTQYLTHVQGMPTKIEQILMRRTQQFLNNDSPTPMISLTTFQQTINDGGKQILNLQA